MRSHKTLNGWLDETDDGKHGVWTLADGRRFTFGDRSILLAELSATEARERRELGEAEDAQSALELSDESELPEGTLQVVFSEGDALSDSARRLLEQDSISPARRGSRTGTPEHERAVEEARRAMDRHRRGRPNGHNEAVRDASNRLDPRHQDPETKAAIEDTRARLTRRPGEPARRNAPSDPATWQGTQAEADEARRQIGDVRIVWPAPKASETPKRPSKGNGWQILGQGRAQGGRRRPGTPPSGDRSLPPSMRRRRPGG